jgi:hypothetical protein
MLPHSWCRYHVYIGIVRDQNQEPNPTFFYMMEKMFQPSPCNKGMPTKHNTDTHSKSTDSNQLDMTIENIITSPHL